MWTTLNSKKTNQACTYIGKHRELSREVTCFFRLYLEIGWTSV